ncbi:MULTISPECIES: hypothetical protein [unclassified Legionella]|uniref:hypothetical protein n=1 Tax=unclassified Legionella TaxID=2622702 RepID=UPI001054FB38|nr:MULTISPECIES: hypothetical protein [unclassified Legionella]MDI9818400.1 hypothetical protein [Legionella sp. PL877]
MKNLLKTILLIIVVAYWPVSLWATSSHENESEKNYFQFVISDYHTTRQAGQTVNIYVRYAYKKDLSTNEYPDYRVLRAKILEYMEPSDEFPAGVFWEILAINMGRALMSDFPLDGVSIQLTVLDNQNPDSYEPGDHGPVVSIGKIAPLDIH